jgi:hypothetical protein
MRDVLTLYFVSRDFPRSGPIRKPEITLETPQRDRWPNRGTCVPVLLSALRLWMQQMQVGRARQPRRRATYSLPSRARAGGNHAATRRVRSLRFAASGQSSDRWWTLARRELGTAARSEHTPLLRVRPRIRRSRFRLSRHCADGHACVQQLRDNLSADGAGCSNNEDTIHAAHSIGGRGMEIKSTHALIASICSIVGISET